jgi:hypothetical protein
MVFFGKRTGERMNMINSSNSEESLLKSAGPFRITKSDSSFAGSVHPEGQFVISTTVYGKTGLHGKQFVTGKPTPARKRQQPDRL